MNTRAWMPIPIFVQFVKILILASIYFGLYSLISSFTDNLAWSFVAIATSSLVLWRSGILKILIPRV